MQPGTGCCAGKHRVRAGAMLGTCDPSHCGERVGGHPVSGTCCVTVIEVDPDTKTSSNECCVWATHCKESAHSKGNNRAAFPGFQWREFFLGQGGGQLLWMSSVGFQCEQGTNNFKPKAHLKWLDLVLFHPKAEIIAAVDLSCDYFLNVPFLNVSFCPKLNKKPWIKNHSFKSTASTF